MAAVTTASNPLARYTITDFKLQSGVVMPEVTLAYRALGKLAADGRNAVLVTHGYTSGPRMIDPADGGTAEGGWSELVGPGKPIDTNTHFVICPNMLGSSFGSTNAASIEPSTGKSYGPRFPVISVPDIVISQRALLDHLGVRHLIAVVGPSYGGFQAFQWAVTFPDFMHGIAAVVTSPSGRADQAQANLDRLNATFAKVAGWNGGDYYGSDAMRATLTDMRVATLKNYGIEAKLAEEFPDAANREAAIRNVATRWADEFDANSMLILAKAMASFNTAAQFAQIKAKVLYVLSRTDKLFPPKIAPDVMQGLADAGVEAQYFEIDSDFGHIASGLDAAKWAPVLRAFMARLEAMPA